MCDFFVVFGVDGGDGNVVWYICRVLKRFGRCFRCLGTLVVRCLLYIVSRCGDFFVYLFKVF